MKSLTLSSNASILAWSGSVKIQEDKNTTSIISNAAIVTSRWLSLIAWNEERDDILYSLNLQVSYYPGGVRRAVDVGLV